MAITASGIGSGLDINGLVTSLVQAEREPVERRIIQQQTQLQAQLSATATLQGVLGGFRSAAQALTNPSAWQARTATSSDPDSFTASAQANAAAGSYSVQVVQLAEAQKTASHAFADGEGTGTGTLTFTSGERNFAVTVSSSDDSLTNLRDSINSAAGNDFVRATIINTDGGQRLVLTATETGADNAFEVSATGALSQFENANMESFVPAVNAQVEIEGFLVSSATNTISDAIEGVTLTLRQVDEVPGTLTVAQNDDTIVNAARGFVEAWNSVNQAIRGLSQVGAEGQASVLTGDAVLRSIAEQLRRELSATVGSINDPFSSLSSLGITMQLDGSLQFNEARFRDALDADPDAVRATLAGDAGYATRLDSRLGDMLSNNGSLATRTDGLNDRLRGLARQREALDARMIVIEQRYRTQFGAMDELVARMRSTGDFLAQQLQNLNNSRSGR